MWYSTDLGLIKTPKAVRLGDINYPANIFTLWSKADLAALNIKPARITAVDGRLLGQPMGGQPGPPAGADGSGDGGG